ncbi:MAG TPA: DUF3857 domain-containing protein [Candidatus Limisoma intestinavium]|uniref:DUF3857 domain-containing protein n=1 Tax=Candidatus Limisoma intestinavium TaxID=2840856 RepID=A0A9D1IJ99_9BACT|nr:DUF3857 domain-containing protein [Candidatus Limisoma intestinavium]
MIKSVLFTGMLLCLSVPAFGLEVNEKFGKPTMEEMEMTVYDADPEADAVVLYKEGNVNYRFDASSSSGFIIEYDVVERIKVLTSDGVDFANVSVGYYDSGLASDWTEKIINVKAASFNLENGKIKKTDLDKDMIFKENVYEDYWRLKFSIPEVRAGSVIEYRYKIVSERLATLRTWKFQHSIPTLCSRFEVAIPEYFIFNISKKGYEDLEIEQNNVPKKYSIVIRGDMGYHECMAREIKAEGMNLPALKEDEYIFDIDEYMTQIAFEISGVNYPWDTYKSFSTTWEDVDKIFNDSGSFKKGLRLDNPYKDEIAFDSSANVLAKSAAIVRHVGSRLKWNGEYQFTDKDIDDRIKEGIGSNAVINFAIMSMMRENGIQCYPVVLRLRSHGMLPFVHPTFDDLDTFVVGFEDEQGKQHFIDGSYTDCGVDILPVDMLVDKARIITPDYEGERWVSLSRLSSNMSRTNILVNISGDTLRCMERQMLSGQYAAALKKAYKSTADSAKFVDALATSMNATIRDVRFKGMTDNTASIVVDTQYELTAEATDSLIYIYPTITPAMLENPFVEETRELPVEFGYPTERVTMVQLTIPDGYYLEELPEQMLLRSENNEIEFSFVSNLTGNNLTMIYKHKVNATLFPYDLYPLLHEMYTRIADKNNEMIVLKKKS